MNNNIKKHVYCNSEVAQFVILDFGVPNQTKITDLILDSVSNVLCLSQVGHIPAIGLAVVNASYQPVVKLSSTQSSFKLQKILQAIKSFKETVKCRARISKQEFQDCIHLGIKTALEDFENFLNQLTEGENNPEKLQITIFSMRNLIDTLDYMKMALPLLKIKNLFKIQVVELTEDFLSQHHLRNEPCSYTFLEYIQVAGTLKKLDEVMKQWLICGDVAQHLNLVIQKITIWCDARDCIIRPTLPSPTNTSTVTSGSEEVADDTDTQTLEVIHRIPTVGICETRMFGDPVLLTPCHWQNHLHSVQHEALNHNAKYFVDVCSKLGMSEEYLIAKYEKRNQPVRFMLLMPGEGFLLVKELVSAEMAFPIPNIPPNLSPFSTFKMDSEVTTALSCLPSISTYDPSEFSSKLYKHLLRKIEHPKPMQLKQESTCTDPSHKSIVVSLEVKKKTRVKKKITEGNRLRRSLHLADPLPKLSESDQQTLAQCLSRQREKFKSSLHQNVK